MEEKWGRGGESGGGAGGPTLGGPASAAVPGPRQSPAAEGARCAAGTAGGTRAGVDPGCRPAPTGSYLGLLLGHGCARRRGGNGVLDSAGAGESRSRPAALPPQMLAGPRFAPQIPERWLAGARSRGRRACTTRVPGTSSARPAAPRFLAVRNASRGGASRDPSGPHSRGRSGLWAQGPRWHLRGARGSEGGGPEGRTESLDHQAGPGAASETRLGTLLRGLAATSVPWSTDLVPHLLR